MKRRSKEDRFYTTLHNDLVILAAGRQVRCSKGVENKQWQHFFLFAFVSVQEVRDHEVEGLLGTEGCSGFPFQTCAIDFDVVIILSHFLTDKAVPLIEYFKNN